MNLEQHLRTELERLASLKPKLGLGKVLLAVSGGQDSMALLHAAHAIGLDAMVAHLDHGIRAASSDDASFVQRVCARLDLACEIEKVNVPEIAAKRGWGLEETARRLRYDFLTRVAKQVAANAILTAHHREDHAETVLLQLLRGAAQATGIPARRDRILRPLLGVRRGTLRAYLTERGLQWQEDGSNTDTRFMRNWLRQRIVPLLETRFPNLTEKLAEHALLASSENELLEVISAAVPTWSDWRREPVAVQRRLIRRKLEMASVGPDFAHIEALRQALDAPKVSRVSLPKHHTGVVQQGQVKVFAKDHAVAGSEWPTGFDFSAFPWAQLRTRAAGDRVRLAGGTRKLSDVLIDRHVAREQRDGLALVAQNSEVLWVDLKPPVLDVRIAQTQDNEFAAMKSAILLAKEAAEAGEVPVGAVVLHAGQIIGQGRNRCVARNDMTWHAELEAIRQAAQSLGASPLENCTLVVTLEPCVMCLGAVLESRIGKVVFGARNAKNGALGGVQDVGRGAWNHTFEVRAGLLERECSGLLTGFFSQLRNG